MNAEVLEIKLKYLTKKVDELSDELKSLRKLFGIFTYTFVILWIISNIVLAIIMGVFKNV